MKDKICVIGFAKCGQVSLVRYLKNKYPKVEILRPEVAWADTIHFMESVNVKEFSFVAIIRNPIDRIQSGVRYWHNIKEKYNTFGIERLLKGIGPFGFRTGWQDPIEQSNYNKYLEKFEIKHDVNIEKVYQLEEMVKDPNFPFNNKSDNRTTFSEEERNLIQNKVNEMMDHTR